jgi:hypothetical protein
MSNDGYVTLKMYPLELVALHALLVNVRLGDRSIYESAISNLLILMEDNGVSDFINATLEVHDLDMPRLGAEFSTEDGLILNIS